MTTPLGDFKVDWNGIRQSFTEPGSGRSATAPSHVSRLFTWTDIDRKGEARRPGAQFRHMFYSKLDVVDHDEWQFERALGKGGYGAAALFRKRDASQNVIDEFALKVTDIRSKYTISDRKAGLTKEAAIMAQTNDLGCDSILRLRQYKEHSYEMFCRYYFEFCDLGNLYDLRLKYLAWNMHFPETFLWHIFYHLARACAEFADADYRSLKPQSFGEMLLNGYLIHGDIKLDNILLRSTSASPHLGHLYPLPKVADFGLATLIEGRRRPENRAANLRAGHASWSPPELRVDFMRDPNRYFFDRDTEDDEPRPYPSGEKPRDQHRILSGANVWAVGAVMWILASHGDIRELSKRINSILMGDRAARDTWDRTNLIGLHEFGEAQYSAELLELIQECTRLKPEERPSAASLLDTTELRMQKIERDLGAIGLDGLGEGLKVHFKSDDFKALPRGDAVLPPLPEYFWLDYANHLVWEPPGAELVCPPSAPRDLVVTERCPDAVTRNLTRRWKTAIRRRDNPRVSPPPAPAGPALPENARGRKRRADEMDQDEAVNAEADENEGGAMRWLRRWRWW